MRQDVNARALIGSSTLMVVLVSAASAAARESVDWAVVGVLVVVMGANAAGSLWVRRWPVPRHYRQGRG